MKRYLRYLTALAGLCLFLGGAHGAEDAKPAPDDAADQPGESDSSTQVKKARVRVRREGSGLEVDNGREMEPVVRIFGDAHVPAGRVVDEVVVIFGDANIEGTVRGNVVDVLGRIRLRGKVAGSVVNVGQGVTLEDSAVVEGKVVGVFGGVKSAAGAEVHGETISAGGWFNTLPPSIHHWVSSCFYKLRPMAPSSWVSWAISLALLLVYLVLALLFPAAVQSCARSLHERPISTFFLGLAGLPLACFLGLLLGLTGVGLFVVPFLFSGLVAAALMGKAGLMCFLGDSLLRKPRGAAPAPLAILLGWGILVMFYFIPILGLLVWKVTAVWGLGSALQACFSGGRKEMAAKPLPAAPSAPRPGGGGTAPAPAPKEAPSAAPVAPVPPAPAATALAAVAALPLAVVTAAVDGPVAEPKREDGPSASPSAPADVPLGGMANGPTAAPPGAVPPAVGAGLTGSGAGVAAAGASTPSRPVSPPRNFRPASSSLGGAGQPAVSFWPRFFVAALDWLVVGLAVAVLVPDLLDYSSIRGMVFLAYFAGFWVWRGATPMGIVFGHKVVRLDGRPIDVPCAVVRAIMAAAGGFALGLGFFWCAWDPERQTWHDKIAGTRLVKLSKVEPLV